jgi:hypothetical protein
MQLRWPDGSHCPRCGCRESSAVRTVLLRCRDCRHQTSVTAGTIFQDTRTSLRLWFQAVWWMTSQKNGVSALGLQRVLGLNSYETAWTWLHKLRRAMVRPGRDLLTGRVEVDECYIGGLEEGLPGRLNLDKALIVVAAQEDGPGITGKRHPHRRLAGLCALGAQRLQARGHILKRQKENSLGVDAAGPPRYLPPQTVATGNPPGGGQP